MKKCTQSERKTFDRSVPTRRQKYTIRWGEREKNESMKSLDKYI